MDQVATKVNKISVANKIKPLLSICIPTYNRYKKLFQLIMSILESDSIDFEVVVLDNCSSDETKDMIINDSRVRIVHRKEKVSGNKNCIEALYEGNGTFAMLCLDKDFIVGGCLSNFIQRLKNTESIACGYCEIDSKREDSDFVVDKLIEDSMFTCKHPSGYFFNRAYLNKINDEVINDNNYNNYYDMPYGIELFYAHTLTYGKECIYNSKLVIKHKEISFSDEKSLTYGNGKKPLFYLPEEQRNYFKIFVYCLNELNIDLNTYKKILKRLIFRTLYRGSLIYWTLPKYVVEHYEIKYRGFKIINILKDFYRTVTYILNFEDFKASKQVIVYDIISNIFIALGKSFPYVVKKLIHIKN